MTRGNGRQTGRKMEINKRARFWLILWAAIAVLAGSLQQGSAACLYDISPYNRTHGYALATGVVNVATFSGCGWSSSTTNGWITIISGGSGSASGMLTYSVAANPNTFARTGSVMVAGLPFTISQNPAACNYNLSPTTRSHGYSMATGSVTMVASSGCAWTAATTNNWITLHGAISGVGNGSFTYVVSANTNASQRIGWITAADDFLIITQRAVACSYSISPTSRNHGYGATTGVVSVTTSGGCVWPVVSTNDWLTVLSGPSGTNVGDVTYAITANPNGFSRTGVLAIGDENFTITQAASPCSYSAAPLIFSLDGNVAGGGVVNVTAPNGCPWTASSPDSWINVTQGNGAGSGPLNFAVQANPNATSRSGTLTVAGQLITVNQGGMAPCSYKISPTSRSHGFGSASNAVTLTTSNHCPWNVVNTNGWITIVNPNGIGPAAVGYLVAANPSVNSRSGVILIADQALTLTQDGANCTFSLSPTTRTHGYPSASNSVTVNANATNCSWGVVNTNTWIALQPTNGVGSANVSYFLAANSTFEKRTGVVQVAGQSLTIIQRGLGCAYEFTPGSRTHGNSAAMNSITLITDPGCAWSVGTTNGWISITSPLNGSGSSTINYSVSANSSLNSRTGIVTVADQVFTIRQNGIGCDYSISPTSRNHGHGAATNSLSLTATAGCEWMVINTNDWISITSTSSGVGSAVVSYTVAPNPAAAPRSGVIAVADQTFTILQSAAPCTYVPTPENLEVDAVATNGSVNLASPIGCAWNVVNTNSWITLTSPSSGTSSAVITFNVLANTTTNDRIGNITIGNATVTITQLGQGTCVYKITPGNRIHGSGSASNYVALTTAGYCTWTAVNTNNWISIVGPTSGTGGANIGYQVAANPGLTERTGSVVIAGQLFVVAQRGIGCDYNLSPTNRNHGAGAATNLFSVTANAGCSWMVVNTNTWISVVQGTTGAGPGDVTYTVQANPTFNERSGVVVVAGLPFTITQKGLTCDYSISPATRTHGYGGSGGMISLNVPTVCQWAVVNTNSWVSIASNFGAGTGGAQIDYTVAPNSSLSARTGMVMIADQVFTVIQSGFDCNFKLSPVTRTHGFGMATNTISVTTTPNCTWNVDNPNSWITIANISSSIGNGIITYMVSPNFTPEWRTGVVMVADQALTIAQRPIEGFAFDYIRLPDGQVDLRMSGGPAGGWEIYESSNLVTWQKIATLTNVTGTLEFFGARATNSQRFYKAVKQQ
jgi:hypothetical protein